MFEDPYSLAVGVGHSGSDDEEPLPPVRRADVSRGDDAALHTIPEPVEVGDNSVQPASNEGPHVLDDDRAGAQFADDAGEFSPESGPGAGETLPFARLRDVLTREPSTNHLHRFEVRGADAPHVIVPRRVGPVHREHAAAPRIDLHLPPHGPEPSQLEAKLQAADAGEEGADRHTVTEERSNVSPRSVTE